MPAFSHTPAVQCGQELFEYALLAFPIAAVARLGVVLLVPVITGDLSGGLPAG